jgi:hypothetical protein
MKIQGVRNTHFGSKFIKKIIKPPLIKICLGMGLKFNVFIII